MPVVPPPELPRLIVNGNGPYKYVFTYKNRWDKTDKVSKRGKGDTKSVGRFIPDKDRAGYGEIIFKDSFIEQFPQLKAFRVFRHKGGKLEFKPVDKEKFVAAKPACIVRLHGGASWALNQIVTSSAFGKALKVVFSDCHAHLKLLSLAYYLVINRDSSLCNFEEFAECTWLPWRQPLKSSSISRLLQGITKDKVSRFLQVLSEESLKLQGSAMTKRRFWALDSSSALSYSENISTTQCGYDMDLVPMPQANVLLVVDQQTGEPVYYRNFDGSAPDVRAIRSTLAELAMLKIDCSQVILVTDKSCGSNKNRDDMLRSGMRFISSTRRDANSPVKALVDEHYGELLDWNNGIGYLDQNAVAAKIQWPCDEFSIQGKGQQKKTSRPLHVHMYYSQRINEEMGRRLRLNLFAALAAHRKDPRKLTDEQSRIIERYVDIDEASGEARISMKKVDKALRYAGVHALVTDSAADALECAAAYYERNEAARAFNVFMSQPHCRRTAVHLTQAWEGRLFLQMLAVAVGSMVRARVRLYDKNAREDKKYRVYCDSDARLLARLNNIYVTQFSGGWKFDEVDAGKQELFKVLNVPVPSVEKATIDAAEEGEEPEGPEDAADFGLNPAADPESAEDL